MKGEVYRINPLSSLPTDPVRCKRNVRNPFPIGPTPPARNRSTINTQWQHEMKVDLFKRVIYCELCTTGVRDFYSTLKRSGVARHTHMGRVG